MTQIERKKQQLNRHYEALQAIALKCGIVNPNGKKLSVNLWKLEQAAHKLSTDYCNGDNGITSDTWSIKIEPIEKEVQKLFNNNLKGFFVNGDCRGYALKIDTDIFNANYRESGLQNDWGGYGLLSPEINGK